MSKWKSSISEQSWNMQWYHDQVLSKRGDWKKCAPPHPWALSYRPEYKVAEDGEEEAKVGDRDQEGPWQWRGVLDPKKKATKPQNKWEEAAESGRVDRLYRSRNAATYD